MCLLWTWVTAPDVSVGRRKCISAALNANSHYSDTTNCCRLVVDILMVLSLTTEDDVGGFGWIIRTIVSPSLCFLHGLTLRPVERRHLILSRLRVRGVGLTLRPAERRHLTLSRLRVRGVKHSHRTLNVVLGLCDKYTVHPHNRRSSSHRGTQY